MGKNHPDLWWHPQRRCLVRVNANLVEQAKGATYSSWGGDSVDCQKFIFAAGAEVYLLAGLLGLGIGYLIASASRLPRYGEPVKVFPYGAPPKQGPWQGVDGNGYITVGDRTYSADDLALAGPVRELKQSGQRFIDLSKGFVNPDELAALSKAHDRNGYKRRKGGR